MSHPNRPLDSLVPRWRRRNAKRNLKHLEHFQHLESFSTNNPSLILLNPAIGNDATQLSSFPLNPFTDILVLQLAGIRRNGRYDLSRNELRYNGVTKTNSIQYPVCQSRTGQSRLPEGALWSLYTRPMIVSDRGSKTVEKSGISQLEPDTLTERVS